MKPILVLSLLFFGRFAANAQLDSASLLKEVSAKLENKSATISSILSDKRYLSIHPHTPFRELISNYATTAVLKITTADEPGKKIRVLGTVVDEKGKPVAGAIVYLYQTDAKGWYAAGSPHVQSYEGDIRHARLFGYVKTNAEGRFELNTVKPSGYPQSDLPAHIHVHVSVPGYRNYGTEFLFDDDERLVGKIRENSIRNQFLISKPETAPAGFAQQFSYKMVLQKN